MIPPCPKCGATKTDPVEHDFRYEFARALGYRRQICSRCRRTRYLPRRRGTSRDSSPNGDGPKPTGGLAEEPGRQAMVEAPPAQPQPVGVEERLKPQGHGCPACGSGRYHHTHRTDLERLLRRPSMARCENCGSRFPYPGHRKKNSEAGEAAAAEPSSMKEVHTPKMANENSEAPRPEAFAEPPSGALLRCPACGSTKHHRTERTPLERVLGRPPMGRCEKCGKRFPYHNLRGESSGSSKSGQSPANRNPAPEGQGGSGTTEGSIQPKVGIPGSTADADEGLSGCPFCGSKTYRRSRRTTMERLMFRPKMARCTHCRKRFPFPVR